MSSDPDEYAGPAVLVLGEQRIAVTFAGSGRLEPIDGRYHWTGRLAPDSALAGAATRTVSIEITGGAPALARLGQPDPWGGIRVTGVGAPPWPFPG